ncbi:response regulator [Rhizobium rhizoryzae]|jgi:DNA-binding response OmpR family regulator|uniref:response regulator n=1 Tax=Rhizobium rhizoryzae TaxID=451876 RepID=UPI00289CF16E|nr:response regulator [Rhizobium rhizoryzae]
MNSTGAPSSLSVLVLEDDMLLAMDMEDHLISRGFQVHGPFGRVGDAMDSIGDLEIDLAIVDLNLNGEFSFPVIELLNQRSVPVIVCSGYVELPEVRTRLQGIPHVGKPWMPERLDALMRDVLTATRVVG